MDILWVKWSDEENRIIAGPQSVPRGDNWYQLIQREKIQNHETQHYEFHKVPQGDDMFVVIRELVGDPTPTYSQNRRAEYPSLEEQLDYIYHNGVDAWKADIIDPIKAANPKPAEE